MLITFRYCEDPQFFTSVFYGLKCLGLSTVQGQKYQSLSKIVIQGNESCQSCRYLDTLLNVTLFHSETLWADVGNRSTQRKPIHDPGPSYCEVRALITLKQLKSRHIF